MIKLYKILKKCNYFYFPIVHFYDGAYLSLNKKKEHFLNQVIIFEDLARQIELTFLAIS